MSPEPRPPLQRSPNVHPSGDKSGSGPCVTPGLIISTLSPARLTELRNLVQSPSKLEPNGARDHCIRMLAAMKVDELQKVARAAGLPDDGSFIDLYRRLVTICS